MKPSVRVALMAAATLAAFVAGELAARAQALPDVPIVAAAVSLSPVVGEASGSQAAGAAPRGGEAAARASSRSQADEDDMEPQPAQPDFTVVNLPTTLRLPVHRLAFRVTHRFTRPLNQDGFRNSLSDAFGLDSGAQVGLELRFAPLRGAQVGVYRTSDKTIDFFGEYNLLQQGDTAPVSISAVGAVEGTSNFTDVYSPSLGVTVSHSIGKAAAIYAVPTWVHHTNPFLRNLVDRNDTVFVGLGARVQVRRGLYLTGEASPRIAGFKGGIGRSSVYTPGRTLAAFALEKQVGGHVFQINFSNAFATTPANIARGAAPGKTNWYLGFNISRKFY